MALRVGAWLPSRLSQLGVAACARVGVWTQTPPTWPGLPVVRVGRGLFRTAPFSVLAMRGMARCWVSPDSCWCFPCWGVWLSCVGWAVPHQSWRLGLSGVVVLLRPRWLPVPASPGGRAVRGGRLCGGHRRRCLSSPPFFAGVVGVGSRPSRLGFSVGRGGGVLGCGSQFFRVEVHWWSLLLVPDVVSWVPAPPLLLFCRQSLLFPGPCGWLPAPFWMGVCAGMSGVFFLARRWLCGRRGPLFFSLHVVRLCGWSFSVLSVGPVGVACGVAWLGVLPASLEWVRGLAVVWLFLLLSSAPLGWRACASGV